MAFYGPLEMFKESEYYQIYRFIVTVVSMGLGLICYKFFYQKDDSKKISLTMKILAVVLLLYYIAFIFIQVLGNITIWIPALIYLGGHFNFNALTLWKCFEKHGRVLRCGLVQKKLSKQL